MASLALGIAGVALAPVTAGASTVALYGAIGSAIGGLIDSFVVNPLLSPRPSVNGPRLDDVRLATASEGSVLAFCNGPENRVSGRVIWLGPLIEVESEIDSGGKGGGGGGSRYDYYVDVAIAWCEGPISRVRELWLDAKLVYSPTQQADARYEAITHYLGTESQTPSSVIEAVRGAGNVPAYRGTAYTVIKRLALQDFGNRLPNASATIEQASSLTLAGAIERVLLRYGFEASEFDTTRLRGCVRGYTIGSVTDGVGALRPLLAVHGVLAQQVGTKLVLFHRGAEPRVSVPSSDLGAYGSAGSPVVLYTLEDTPGFRLPTECVVTYVDPEIDYQNGAQTYPRPDRIGEGVLDLQVPLVMSSVEAQNLARTTVWQMWAERRRARLALPPKYWALREGEVLDVTLNGSTYSIRVTELTMGANYAVEVLGTVVEVTAASAVADDDFTGTDTGEPGPGSGGGGAGSTLPYTPPAVRLEILDIPALRETDTTVPGAYWAMCAADAAATWRGAAALGSNNNVDFAPLFSSASEQVVGTCTSVLGAGPWGQWDNGSALEVELLHGTLQSITDAAVLEGGNWAVVGTEVLGFATATFLGGRRYRLTRLLRGLRGTEGTIAFHQAGERFVPVSAFASSFWTYGSGLIGASRWIKGVATGAVPVDVAATSVPLRGNTLRQFAPCNLRVVRDGSRNLTISWTRRSRALVRLFAPGTGPLLADREEYDVDLYQPQGVLKATLRITDATSATVTTTAQAGYGIDTAQNIVATVQQLGPVVGRGFASPGVVG